MWISTSNYYTVCSTFVCHIYMSDSYIMFFVLRYGYVDFHSAEEAKEYLKMNGMELRGQYLNIDLATSRRRCKIYAYIQYIPWWLG